MAATILEISGLTHYFGGLRAVGDFNLKMEEGELMGLIGPNGAGKTTVFNLMTGVYKATHGSVKLAGSELVGLPPFAVSALGVARTFQTLRLYGALPVIDNVSLGERESSNRNRWNCLNCSAWRTGLTKMRLACLTANNDAWRSAARWPRTRNCCCWTSRRRA